MEDRFLHTADLQLLKQLKTGNEAAYTELYKRYHKGIYAYLLGFVKLPYLAEDIVHEVFMKLWEARESITVTTSFSAYLYRIARNKAIDILKKISIDKTLRKEILESLPPLITGFETELQSPGHYEEMYRNALAALSPQRQKTFILCKEEGKTYDEAAMELGISRNTVKDHIVQSMRFLRSYFTKTGQMIFMAIVFGV